MAHFHEYLYRTNGKIGNKKCVPDPFPLRDMSFRINKIRSGTTQGADLDVRSFDKQNFFSFIRSDENSIRSCGIFPDRKIASFV
ncbi:MAG: hypothetical protein C4527_11210 [Candidatus Omnitrophota bacterium]|nr:MAG: hypothetical protein C4527_11210 [Candidatus Omnitrophota bacterium]